MPNNPRPRRAVVDIYRAKIQRGVAETQAINETAIECDLAPGSVGRYIREEKLLERDALPPSPTAIPLAAAESLSSRLTICLKASRLTLVELADKFGVPPREILAAVEELRSNNILVNEFGGGLEIARSVPINETPQTIDLSKHREVEYPIGVVSDSHNASKYERLDVLNALYDRFAEYGVETVYHAGNWIDGECRFNKHDIHKHGFNDQQKYFIEVYPHRAGITTHIISGDDHEGWSVQREGIDVGKSMELAARAAERQDLFDLGYMERDIRFEQEGGGATLRVIHAGGGSTYATSYTSQKYAESLQGGEKPSVVVVGHFHKFDYSYPREVHMIQPGCVCDQTPWMRKKRIEAHVGGVVLWIRQADNGVFTSVKVQWMPFYDKKFYQYYW